MNAFPRCAVCQECFKLYGPAPYLLPCLHAVCETCVTSAAGGVISCSTCQKEVNLTETHLQKDVVRHREIFHLSVQHSPSELLCTNDDDGNEAVCWCQECKELFCEYCQIYHEGVKTHTLKKFVEIQPGEINHEQFCSLHKGSQLNFWDKTCNILICNRCIRDGHEDHDVDDADSTRVEIEDAKKKFLLTKDRHRSAVETAKVQLNRSTETHKMVRENIIHTFESLKSCLEQRKREILLEHDRQTGSEAEFLNKTKESSESGLLVSESTAEYIDKALLYLSKYDLLTVKRTIRERTQSCLAERLLERPPGFLKFQFTTVGLEKLKSSVSCFGQIAAVQATSPQMSQANSEDAEDAEDGIHSARLKTRFEEESKSLMRQRRHARLEHLKILEAELEEQGLYCLKKEDGQPAYFLKCTHLKLDTKRVNLQCASFNSNGELSNSCWTWTFMGKERERLQKYEGTCSTFPLTRSGSAQYWETVSKVRMNKALEESNLILEIGLVREEERDNSFMICKQPHSYSLTVNHCMEHKGVCRQFWKHGIHVQCLPDTLANKPGTSVSLHYGVIYDDVRNMVAFLDVKENRVMAVFNHVDPTYSLWPMFGVSNPRRGNVSIKLVAGVDIEMIDQKKEMILQVLANTM